MVKFYDSFYNNGDISTVLEYMDGGSLAEFLKRNTRIAEPYLAAICKQVKNLKTHKTHELQLFIVDKDLLCPIIFLNI